MSNINFESITLERIVGKSNLNKAYKKVINNRGSAGVDGMETCELHLAILRNILMKSQVRF